MNDLWYNVPCFSCDYYQKEQATFINQEMVAWDLYNEWELCLWRCNIDSKYAVVEIHDLNGNLSANISRDWGDQDVKLKFYKR